MTTDSEIDRLTERFQALGAGDPRSWAESQVREGLPQLARFLFLRQAWRAIVSEDDPSWIAAQIAAMERDPNGPYSGIGRALKKLKDRGITDGAITDLVRGMQAKLLFSLCYLLEDPAIDDPAGQGVRWRLVEVTEKGQPLRVVGGLHESVLDTDPTGREMRPR